MEGIWDNTQMVRENNRERLMRYANQVYRIISGEITNPVSKSLHSFGDRRDAEKYLIAFRTGGVVKTKTTFSKKGVFKTSKNPIREVAWIVVHSYVTDYFLDAYHMVDLMNKVTYNVQIDAWNSSIRSMGDIPIEIKNIFIIDSETRISKFQYWVKNNIK
jgi:hypothetical protein